MAGRSRTGASYRCWYSAAVIPAERPRPRGLGVALPLLPQLFPLLVGLLVYLPSLRGTFVWDDTIYLGRWITGVSTIRDMFFPTQTAGEMPFYKPVAAASQYLHFLLFKTWAPGWHLGGVLLHLAAIAGVHRLLLRWWAGGPRPARGALVGATLFACWPAAAEPLGWISARSELLVAVLLVFAMCLHLSARDRGKSALPAAALFLLAMLSKETALAFVVLAPAATVLLPPGPGATHTGRPAWLASALWLPYPLAYVAYTALRRRAMGSGGSIGNVAAAAMGRETVGPALRAWGYYVKETLLLGPGAPYMESPPEGRAVLVFAGIGVALGLLAVAAVRKPDTRPLTLAGLWFTGFVGPPIAVVAASISITAVAMRYLYVPTIALAAIAAWAASRVPDRFVRAPAVAIGVVVVALLGWSVQGRLAPWMSEHALWERAYADHPLSSLAALNLSNNLQRADPERSEDLLRIAAYVSVPKDKAHTKKALVRLANLYIQQGRFEQAVFTLRHAARFPSTPEVNAAAKRSEWTLELYRNTAPNGPATMTRSAVLRNAAALEEAIRLDPLDRAGRILLATLYESLGELVRAREAQRELLPLTVAAPDLRASAEERITSLDARIAAEPDPLRRLYFEAQEAELATDDARAIRAYESALAIAPDRVDLLLPLAEIRGRSDPAAARAILERAAALLPNDASVWMNLGLACYTTADYPSAIGAFTRAAELRPEWAKPYLHRGRAFDKMRDPGRAGVEYEAFLARHPDEDEVRRLVQARLGEIRAN